MRFNQTKTLKLLWDVIGSESGGRHELYERNYTSDHYWISGALLAIACGIMYLAVRPPLFDNDGYRDRLYGLQRQWYYNANPHHLLWIPIQAFVGRVAAWLGHPTTIPFQVVGILVSCATLLFLFVLLRRACGNAVFAGFAVIFVAFSREFWHLGLQNRPYALVFLALVLYLMVWQTADGTPPTGSRLLVAGLLLLVLALLQQAIVLLVPAAVIVLLASGHDSLEHRLIKGLVWGGSIAVLVLLVYLGAWKVDASDSDGFFHWTTNFAYVLHSPSLYDLGLRMCLIKSVMGISGTLLQSTQIKQCLAANLSSRVILAIYSSIGILASVAVGAWVWRGRSSWLRLIRVDALFATSLLSMLFWSAFVFVWQPAEPHFWSVAVFPALVCLGLVLREHAWHGLWAFAAIALVLSGWNGYFNIEHDRYSSRNFPEPLLAAIQEHVGPLGIFIVLDRSWFAGMDYDLLFESLSFAPRNPGVAILNYFLVPDEKKPFWQKCLHDKIESTLDSGGPVFVAAHVFDPDAYADLTGIEDPFAIAIYKDKGRPTIPGTTLYAEVRQVFAPYEVRKSDFAIGWEKYFLLQRKLGADAPAAILASVRDG